MFGTHESRAESIVTRMNWTHAYTHFLFLSPTQTQARHRRTHTQHSALDAVENAPGLTEALDR